MTITRGRVHRTQMLVATIAVGAAFVLFSPLGSAAVEDFEKGEVLTSTKLNGNFADLNGRVTALEEAAAPPTITAWQNYTPSLMTNGNVAIAAATSAGSWRRVGDSIEVRIRTVFGGPPQSGATWWHWSLPTGLTIDDTKLGSGTPSSTAGYLGGGFTVQGIGSNIALGIYRRTATTVSASANGAGTYYINDNVPFAWATGGEMNIQFTVPIEGWETNN